MIQRKIQQKKSIVTCVAKAQLPTQYGPFELYLYHDHLEDVKKDHIVLVKGNVRNKSGVLTRIHSECLTGDVFGSLRCDCAEQLHSALESLSNEKQGLLLYLRQEGRGIGLKNKILAYELQEKGLDTISANEALGLPVDSRDYNIAVSILDDLKVKSIRLLTNNPQKLGIFETAHIPCVERIPIEIHANPYNYQYLEIKRDKMGHYLTPKKIEIFSNDRKYLSLMKFIYFFDETRPNFEFSNFGAKGIFHNQYNEKGSYLEMAYHACKFHYLKKNKRVAELKKQFFTGVKTPSQAFWFMRKERDELDKKSINEVIMKNGWLSLNEYKITNKELEMLLCLLNKFDPDIHPELFKKLTGVVNNNKIVLVEANPEDTFWGYKNESKRKFGKNKLGLMLTAIAHTVKKNHKSKIANIVHKYRELVNLFDGFNFHI